jgi:hypothetical protein
MPGKRNEMQELLAAEGPHPEFAEQLMLFGRFVGSWDLEMTAHLQNGSSRSFLGEWHFGWVLQGRAIQDVLIATPVGDPAERDIRQGIGTTLRVYDPQWDAWWVVWTDPVDREFNTLIGRPVGDRIVLEGLWRIDEDARRFEWSFSDITDRSFSWQARISDDGGQTWRAVQDVSARRRTD